MKRANATGRILPALAAALALVAAPGAGAQTRAPGEDPSAAAARFNTQLGIEYLKQNNVAAAQQTIERALTQNARDPNVHTAAGLLYERLAEPDKADKHFARAIKLDPKNPDMLNNYAVFLCRNGQQAKGGKLFAQAAASPLYRTPEVAFTNAGVCARSAKDLAGAEQWFRKALAAQPANPDALLQMADLSFERGNGLQARAFLQRYFQNGPATPDALYLGVRIERALGDTASANDYAAQLRKSFPTSDQARQLADAPQGG
jgi:type IV pilus assembly protein PilF